MPTAIENDPLAIIQSMDVRTSAPQQADPLHEIARMDSGLDINGFLRGRAYQVAGRNIQRYRADQSNTEFDEQYSDFERDFNRLYPGLNAQEYFGQYQQYRNDAFLERYITQEAQSASQAGSWTEYGIERIPFFGEFYEAGNRIRDNGAARRVQAGIGTTEDFATVGAQLAEQDRQNRAGFWGQVGDTVARSGQYALEFMIAGSTVNNATQAATESAFLQGMSRSLGPRVAAQAVNTNAFRGASWLMSRSAGTAAQVAVSPGRAAGIAADRAIPNMEFVQGEFGPQVQTEDGRPFAEELPAGVLLSFIQMGAERSGDRLSRFLGIRPGQANALAQRAAFNGIIGEMLEERAEEYGALVTGLEDQGILPAIFAHARSVISGEPVEDRHNLSRVANQLGVELTSIGIMSGGFALANRATNAIANRNNQASVLVDAGGIESIEVGSNEWHDARIQTIAAFAAASSDPALTAELEAAITPEIRQHLQITPEDLDQDVLAMEQERNASDGDSPSAPPMSLFAEQAFEEIQAIAQDARSEPGVTAMQVAEAIREQLVGLPSSDVRRLAPYIDDVINQHVEYQKQQGIEAEPAQLESRVLEPNFILDGPTTLSGGPARMTVRQQQALIGYVRPTDPNFVTVGEVQLSESPQRPLRSGRTQRQEQITYQPPAQDKSGPGPITSDIDQVTEALGMGPAVQEVPVKSDTPPAERIVGQDAEGNFLTEADVAEMEAETELSREAALAGHTNLDSEMEKAGLTEREQAIIRMRLGVGPEGRPMTQEEIGSRLPNTKTGKMGVTKKAVQKAEKKAMEKLGSNSSIVSAVYAINKMEAEGQAAQNASQADIQEQDESPARQAAREVKSEKERIADEFIKISDQYEKERAKHGGQLPPELKSELERKLSELAERSEAQNTGSSGRVRIPAPFREAVGRLNSLKAESRPAIRAEAKRVLENLRRAMAGRGKSEAFIDNFLDKAVPGWRDLQGSANLAGLPLNLNFLNNILSEKSARRVKTEIHKWLRSGGDLPPAVFEELIKRDNRIEAAIYEISKAESDLKKSVGNYARLTKQEIRTINKALAGHVPSLLSLKPGVQNNVKKMRRHVDDLSTYLIQIGAVQGKMAAIVDKNRGTYLHRSYRVFTDPTWVDNVPDDVKNKFISWLKAEYRANGWAYTDADIEGKMKYYLQLGAASKHPALFMTSGKIGSKDMRILNKRDGIPEALRALWGEHEDPIVNYSQSVLQMTHMIANHEFQNKVVRSGMGVHFSKKPTPEMYQLVAKKGDKTMGPLQGVYASPEVAAAFQEIYSTKTMSTWVKYLVGLSSIAKFSKTVANPIATMRNFWSNGLFAMANGHWRFDKAATVAKRYLDDTDAGRAEWAKLIRLGVVGQDVNAGEIRSLYKDLDMDQKVADALATGMMDESVLKRYASKGVNALTTLYQNMDTVWKIYAFENEMERYKKAYPNWSKDKLEEHCAVIVQNTYPTYARISERLQQLRRFPLVAPFVSFPAEVIRTMAGTAKLAFTELSQKETRKIGATRLAGMSIATFGLSALAAAIRHFAGLTAEDEEDRRRFLPPWSRNSTLFWVGTNAQGEPRYIDASYMDPYAVLRNPITAIWRGEPWQAIEEMFEPFYGEDLVASRLFDIARNAQGDGRQVYNPEAPWETAQMDKLRHLGGALTPGAYDTYVRIRHALEGTHDRNLHDELVSLSGVRVSSLDIPKDLGFNALAYQARQSNIVRNLTSVINSREAVSESDLASGHRDMESVRMQAFNDIHMDAVAAIRQGIPESQVRSILGDRGISDDNINRIISGDYRVWWGGLRFLNERNTDRRLTALKLAIQSMGPEQRQEVEQELLEQARASRPALRNGSSLENFRTRLDQWEFRTGYARDLLAWMQEPPQPQRGTGPWSAGAGSPGSGYTPAPR